MQRVSNERFRCRVPGCEEEFWGPTTLGRHMEKPHVRCAGCGGMFTKVKRHWVASPGCRKFHMIDVETGEKL